MNNTPYARGASGTHPNPIVRRDSALLRLADIDREIAKLQCARVAVVERLDAIMAEIDEAPTVRTEDVAARIAGQPLPISVDFEAAVGA